MCKNTTPLAQPCTIATQAQIEAEKLLKHMLDWGTPTAHQETVHRLFMNWLADVADERDDMDKELMADYQAIHWLFAEMEEWQAKHGTQKQEGVAA